MKLRAEDKDDLNIMSAMMQDAIVPACDMLFHKDQQQFVLVANRFCWEKVHAAEEMAATTKEKPIYERVHTIIKIQGVSAAQYQHIDIGEAQLMLDLLAFFWDGDYLILAFAGGRFVRLSLVGWSVLMEDYGEPWPTPTCPSHALADRPA
jgi:Protein of unknown function (DUF2948)